MSNRHVDAVVVGAGAGGGVVAKELSEGGLSVVEAAGRSSMTWTTMSSAASFTEYYATPSVRTTAGTGGC